MALHGSTKQGGNGRRSGKGQPSQQTSQKPGRLRPDVSHYEEQQRQRDERERFLRAYGGVGQRLSAFADLTILVSLAPERVDTVSVTVEALKKDAQRWMERLRTVVMSIIRHK
jgi:hypothetical protein